MATLKDRQRQIPNGFRFIIPEVGYKSQPFQSFDSIVLAVHSIAQSNPGLFTAKGWPHSRNDVATWVDQFNARYCVEMGYEDYVNGTETEPPKHGPPPRADALVAGAKSLTEWLGAGANPVSREVADKRAETCVKCPLNKEGDLSNFFERGTSEMLRSAIAAAKEIQLITRFDKSLGVCDACYCPMKLKVWMPLHHILKNLSTETKSALHEKCWITNEEKQNEPERTSITSPSSKPEVVAGPADPATDQAQQGGAAGPDTL